ncbi:MAG: hypothetical protein Unbinned3338contig1000_17 [Prokaryotic dsDNA virus sp.]|nr:MAG: hypothetical protein Unbinned3338contig1000_17 [Prokaryotic dsDNA virus sp.]|tara:strand:+ start:6037 stop:6930 length:894 start_codon:yes stop_codon:yes gene_type:complete
MNEENAQGNPKALEDGVFGSDSDNFFEALEQDVNGLVQDKEVTPKTQAQETPQVDPSQAQQSVTDGAQPSEIETLKKRYSDSSREAQKMRAQLNELQPFMPVLDAMKKDGNLVSHVRNYFEEGGNVPSDVKNNLNLPEDFVFDPDEMVNNPESNSRKVFDKMIGNAVNQKASQIMAQQQQQNQQMAYKNQVSKSANEFMQKNGLTVQEFENFVAEAQERFSKQGMTFDDMYLILNQNRVTENVANATKSDMLNQMKNVRNIPTSASNANNAGKPANPSDSVFDALLSSDGNIEELLG